MGSNRVIPALMATMKVSLRLQTLVVVGSQEGWWLWEVAEVVVEGVCGGGDEAEVGRVGWEERGVGGRRGGSQKVATSFVCGGAGEKGKVVTFFGVTTLFLEERFGGAFSFFFAFQMWSKKGCLAT